MIMTNAYGAKDLHRAFMHFNKNLDKLWIKKEQVTNDEILNLLYKRSGKI